MRSTIALIGLVATVGLMTLGCEHDKVPDFGGVRIDNDWTQPVSLYVNDALLFTVAPGQLQGAPVGEGLQRLSVRDAAGKELFGQFADIPDNTFAEYTVLPNGQVIATAGNIRRPEIVGSGGEQIKLENLAAFPVDFFANNVPLATVAPLSNATIDVPGALLTISFRRNNGNVLFQQTLQVPRNTVIHYTVLPEGTVIATGGPIEENTDFAPTYPSFGGL
jgi:hypothetical protein